MKNTSLLLPLQKKKEYPECYLTQYEKQILFKKYINMGWDKEDADKRVKDCVRHLQELRDKMKLQKLKTKDINMRFREEFAKLLDAGR